MNKKGFVLMETLVVTIFTLFIFTILYNTVVPLLGKYEELSYYDDLDTTYDLYHVMKFLKSEVDYSTLNWISTFNLTCDLSHITNKDRCDDLLKLLDIDLDGEDELVYVNTNRKNELLTNNNISYDIKEYIKYINNDQKMLILKKNNYLSYLNILEYDNNETKPETCQSTFEEDGVIYYSGTNECVNNNYLWYSGKMWRIVAEYPDGTKKILSDDNITSIGYADIEANSTSAFETSYVYEWLNEDFLDTLYNYENIILTDYKWNATKTTSNSTKLPETTLIEASVGLLNTYEFYNSCKNISSNCYLKIPYYWYLLNPYDDVNIWSIYYNYSYNNTKLNTSFFGVRPAIVLKSNINLLGEGTKENPYTIEDDITAPTTDTLLNTRVSGEYVRFDNKVYRIVSTENSATKLISVDFVKDSSGSVITKNFASNDEYIYFGSYDKTNENYWYRYLNNTWYNSISATYKSMLKTDTYYLGRIYNASSDRYNYKRAICTAATMNKPVKTCTKLGSSYRYTGYVGMIRYAEMFSTQFDNSQEDFWLITPLDANDSMVVYSTGQSRNDKATDFLYAARPTITVSSSVKITGGLGTEDSPFEISL